MEKGKSNTKILLIFHKKLSRKEFELDKVFANLLTKDDVISDETELKTFNRTSIRFIKR